MVDELRQAQEPAAAALTRHVEAHLGEYPAGRARPRSRLVVAAVQAAVALYVDEAAGGERQRAAVGQLFAKLGRGEAAERSHLDRMQAAWQVATRQAWREICRHCQQAGGGARTLAALGDLLHDLMGELFLYVEAGFFRATRPHDIRARLGRTLLLTPDSTTLCGLSAAVGWRTPDVAVVGVVEHVGRRPDLRQLAGTLAWSDSRHTTVILDAARYDDLRPSLLNAVQPSPVALMGPVAREAIGDAHRWARQALALRRDGVLPPDPVVDCGQWLDLLLMAADPALLSHLTRTALKPFDGVSPGQRYKWALTLHDTVVHGGSANEAATRIGVHANTVRHHRRQLEELFGDGLRQPRSRSVLAMALNAVLPTWRDAAQRRSRRRRQ